LLSGALHFDEKHASFETAEMSAITNEILHRFYTRDLQEKDLKRSVEAAALWGTWKWGLMGQLSCLTKELGDTDEAEHMSTNDILPVLLVALYVFRHFNTWSKLESESDAMSSVIVPILREFMGIQGENRKATLDHDGQARQPDIVGRTEEGHEAYYGELKGMRLSTVSPNLDCSIKRFFQDVPDSVISPDYNHALQAKATGAYVGQQSIPDTGHTSSKRGTWYSLQGEGG
ncbi:hypothetical protein BGZ97_006655, partial [Linnemannia gamsii]